MNRDEAVTEVTRIINEQLDAGNEVENVAGIVLDFLDSTEYMVEGHSPKTFDQLLDATLSLFPESTLGEDNEGQLIVYTNLMVSGVDEIVAFEVPD